MKFNIEKVTNLKWCDAEHTFFECNVKYFEFNETHPTGVMENDSEEHIRTIWANALMGNYGVIEEYTPPKEVAPSVVIGTPDTSDQIDFPVGN